MWIANNANKTLSLPRGQCMVGL